MRNLIYRFSKWVAVMRFLWIKGQRDGHDEAVGFVKGEAARIARFRTEPTDPHGGPLY